MTNNLTYSSFDKEVNMSWYFTGDMPYGYETVEETIFNFNGTRIWVDFHWEYFCFHLDCNFFSHFGVCPRSIFVNMAALWSNSYSEWISHDNGSVMCCTLFQLRNTKKSVWIRIARIWILEFERNSNHCLNVVVAAVLLISFHFCWL